MRLFTKRQLWAPTGLGCLLILLFAGGVSAAWCFGMETFLATTHRVDADVLVVEGWIDDAAIDSAAVEYRLGNYRHVVATGGLSGQPWHKRRWDYSEEAVKRLRFRKISPDEIVRASSGDSESHRTFEMAVAAWRALHDAGIEPKAINVYTDGVHARRSRLVYAKVFGPNVPVGVVAWHAPGFDTLPWWRSSERAVDLIKETIAYAFEALFNSGRLSNSPERGKK